MILQNVPIPSTRKLNSQVQDGILGSCFWRGILTIWAIGQIYGPDQESIPHRRATPDQSDLLGAPSAWWWYQCLHIREGDAKPIRQVCFSGFNRCTSFLWIAISPFVSPPILKLLFILRFMTPSRLLIFLPILSYWFSFLPYADIQGLWLSTIWPVSMQTWA